MRMRLALALLAALQAVGQQTPAGASLTFEVASVKVAANGRSGVFGGCHGVDSVFNRRPQGEALKVVPLGRCVISDARLSHLIGIAYGWSMAELTTGPDWIQRGDLRFNVEAKAEDPSKATEQQLLTMLQNLLAERFQLKLHYEMREAPGFSLTVASGGPKLHSSESDETRISFTGPGGAAMLKPIPGQPVSIIARRCSITMLISLLTATGGAGTGVDKTGLRGDYDFTLSWDEIAGPALSTALREQLGLRMDAEKVMHSILIVDSAQKPAAN